MWIERDISKKISSGKESIQVIRGPRQCGKTSLILRLDPSFTEVSLDDPALRRLAQTDPELFIAQFKKQKLFIDEAQYAPNLFPSLKRRVDLARREASAKETIIRLSGSNQILMDRHVKESLAGRASFFDMNTLSVAEIQAACKVSVQEIMFKGGWPELYVNLDRDPKNFLDDYINSYIEKDVVLSAGIQKSREFLNFTQLLAGRVGQLLDFASFSRDVGVDTKTIKDWVSILERMNIIVTVAPYFSSLSRRLTKAPKVYFVDTGLACRLQGWSESLPILTSPQQGHLFENLVFSEIFKTIQNFRLSWRIFHWRTRAGHELDFIIEVDPQTILAIEAKVSPQRGIDFIEDPEVRKVFGQHHVKTMIVHQEGARVLNENVPIGLLQRALLENGT